MHLLGRHTGAPVQAALWRLILRGDLIVEHPTQHDLGPMDFADASLVAVAERLGLDRIVIRDRTDFSIYRLHDRKPFVIVGP
jgi:hypothetical protein